MKDMLDKIKQIEEKYNELGLTLSDPAVVQDYNRFKDEMLYPFGIQVYKCTACNKWIINVLEEYVLTYG